MAATVALHWGMDVHIARKVFTSWTVGAVFAALLLCFGICKFVASLFLKNIKFKGTIVVGLVVTILFFLPFTLLLLPGIGGEIGAR
jgi:hypothetical protein